MNAIYKTKSCHRIGLYCLLSFWSCGKFKTIAYGDNAEDEREQNTSENLRYVRETVQDRYSKDLGEKQPCIV